MMLLSLLRGIDLEFIKSNFIPIYSNTFISNKGGFFKEPVVPLVIYQLTTWPILNETKNVLKTKVSNREATIIYKNRYITNVETEIKVVKKLDKEKQKLAIIITIGATTLVISGIWAVLLLFLLGLI